MNVNDVVQIRIAEAARRIEAARKRRAELDAARQAGLRQRHAAKLRNLADATVTGSRNAPPEPAESDGPCCPRAQAREVGGESFQAADGSPTPRPRAARKTPVERL
jgi:hypothetical protein